MQISTTPKALQKIGAKQFKIAWDDGHESLFTIRYLRQSCPCALCVDEWTGKPLIEAGAVHEDIEAEKAELVGNYAVAFQFSDGHATGIFSFEKLRALCPCAQCRK